MFREDESFQKKLRELCSEYSDIFSDQLAEKPASPKPFEINIPLELWEIDENRTPVRPQSSTKEVALKENLDEMLSCDWSSDVCSSDLKVSESSEVSVGVGIWSPPRCGVSLVRFARMYLGFGRHILQNNDFIPTDHIFIVMNQSR